MEEILRRILESAVAGFAGDQVMKRTGLGERAEGILDKIIPPAAASDASTIPQEPAFKPIIEGVPADRVMTQEEEQLITPRVDLGGGRVGLPDITLQEPTEPAMVDVTDEARKNEVQDFVRMVGGRAQALMKEAPEGDPQGAAALATVEGLATKGMEMPDEPMDLGAPVVGPKDVAMGQFPEGKPETGFFDQAGSFLTDLFGDEERMTRMALAFNSMRLQPDQGLAQVLGKRLETLQAGRGSGATIAELVKMGRGDLARLVKSGQITPKEALTMALKQPKTSWSTMTGAELKKKFPGQFSQYADDEMFNVSSQGEVKPLYAEPIGKTMGTEAAKASIETVTPIYQNALNAPKAIENLDRTIDIIQKQPINSGLFLDLKNLRDKLLTEFGSKDAVERLTWTQITNSRLGSEVFQLFSALGLGARGMDTPAEREFMREVLTGNLSMTPQALVQLAKTRRETQIEALRKYNMFAESPAMKQYSSGLVTLPKFDLSKYVPVVTPAMMGK